MKIHPQPELMLTGEIGKKLTCEMMSWSKIVRDPVFADGTKLYVVMHSSGGQLVAYYVPDQEVFEHLFWSEYASDDNPSQLFELYALSLQEHLRSSECDA